MRDGQPFAAIRVGGQCVGKFLGVLSDFGVSGCGKDFGAAKIRAVVDDSGDYGNRKRNNGQSEAVLSLATPSYGVGVGKA